MLITLDSVRADRTGFLSSKSNATPNLNRLAGESIIFEHAYAQAPDTLVSHATILTGAYPQSTGLSEIGGTLPPSLPYLPGRLKAQGYHTAAFVSSIDLDPANGLAQGFERGFEIYDAGFRPVIPGDARARVAERSGAETVSRAVAWVDRSAQEPFFLWVHIGDANTSHASYDAAVARADAALGKLLAALKARKLESNTAIVVVADHGQSLGAHGEETHGIFLYDETIHVPLLVKLPQSQAVARPETAERIIARVRLIDIAPTLLEIAGISVPSQMQGQSLLRIARSGSSADQPAFSRSDLPQRGFGMSSLESWRAGKYLYIRAPKPELYETTADASATHNLAQSSKATLDTIAAQLSNFDRRFNGETGKTASELSSSELQKLASLGYVGLQKSAGAVAAVAGIDPKDRIAAANKVIEVFPSMLVPSNPERTIAALDPVVAADPNQYLAQFALGVALAEKASEAQSPKTRNTAEKNAHSAAAQKAGATDAQKSIYAEAAQHLHKAIELQPDSTWAHYEIGATLLQAGDFKTAAIHLEIATSRLPHFAPAHAALAQAYEHLGRAEDAERERAKGAQK
ncbi:MAG: sulfatase-like hydrolase/transferase [Terriglobales bacterium]